MRDHKGDIKQFSQMSRAWYGATNLANTSYVDRVTFGLYSPDGGTSGEMSMVWIPLSGDKPAAKLECFEDGFSALSHFPNVTQRAGLRT